jgi:hypothetical protein
MLEGHGRYENTLSDATTNLKANEVMQPLRQAQADR